MLTLLCSVSAILGMNTDEDSNEKNISRQLEERRSYERNKYSDEYKEETEETEEFEEIDELEEDADELEEEIDEIEEEVDELGEYPYQHFYPYRQHPYKNCYAYRQHHDSYRKNSYLHSSARERRYMDSNHIDEEPVR